MWVRKMLVYKQILPGVKEHKLCQKLACNHVSGVWRLPLLHAVAMLVQLQGVLQAHCADSRSQKDGGLPTRGPAKVHDLQHGVSSILGGQVRYSCVLPK